MPEQEIGAYRPNPQYRHSVCATAVKESDSRAGVRI